MISPTAKFFEYFMWRMRLLFSVETLCFVVLLFVAHRVIEHLIPADTIMLRWTHPELYQTYRIAMYCSGAVILATVYGTGEFIRRKYKYKSLFSYDTKDVAIQEKILMLMQNRPTITVWQISHYTNLYEGHAWAYICELKKLGKIEQTGTRKKPHWILKQPPNNHT